MQATSDKTASANFTQTGQEYSRTIIGSVTGNAYGRTGKGAPYYQWGRKDAFRSMEYTALPADGTTLSYSLESVSVGKAIKTPMTLYNNNGNSYNPIYFNSWNATYTSYSEEKTSLPGLDRVVKTVYDPCPVGYTVPPANTFTVFTLDNMPVDGNGRKYTYNGKTLFFPFLGSRKKDNGDIGWETVIGQYWSAISYSVAAGRRMCISSTGTCNTSLGDQYSHRSYAHTVRPVREK